MKKNSFSIFLFMTVLLQTLPTFALAKTSNDPEGSQWFYTDIGAYKAWENTTGSKDVVVAIIDNGFDANQPDIKDNVWINKKEIPGNNTDDDNNGFIDDVQGWNFVNYDLNKNKKLDGDERLGNNNPIPDVSLATQKEKDKGYFNHGTLVAGLIGAVGNNSKAGTGLNWNIRLMNLKVLENGGIGDFNPLFRAIYYAVDNGADIINISAVGDGSKDLVRAIDYAVSHGVVIVAAAGNNSASLNNDPLYPACTDAGSDVQKVLGVSAIDKSHRIAKFSNYGANCVDITAPGVDIGSTVLYAPDQNLTNLFQDGWDGTSFSTPLVSGAAALIKAVQPDWKAPQIYEALLKTTQHTPSTNEAQYKELFGAGLLQVDRAVQYAVDRLPAARNLKALNRYSTDTGTFETLGLDDSVQSVSKAFLRKLSFVTTFTEGTQTYFLTKRIYKGDTMITIYDSNWVQTQRFTVSGSTEDHIFVDSFIDQGASQVLFLHTTSTPSARVYSLDGTLLKTNTLSLGGPILAATAVPASSGRLKNIAFLTKQNNKNVLETYTALGEKIQTLGLPSFAVPTTFVVGDFDGDRKAEYVFLSNKAGNATVTIIDSLGKIMKQFPVATSDMLSSLQLVIGDYNQDKKDDILTFAKPYNDITVWTVAGTILAHKKVAGSVNPLILIPSF